MLDTRLETNRLDETFLTLIPKSLVPESVHDLYDAYEEWTDKAEEAQATAANGETLIAQAEAKDTAEAEAAISEGKPFTGSPHKDNARAKVADAETYFRAAKSQQQKAARALLTGMRDHEGEISTAIQKAATPVLAEYRQLIHDMQGKAEALASELQQITSAINFAEELRGGESKHLEIGLVSVSLPSVADALNSANRITEQLEALSQKAESNYVHVIGGNGIVTEMKNNDTTKSLIRSGSLRLATPRERAGIAS